MLPLIRMNRSIYMRLLHIAGVLLASPAVGAADASHAGALDLTLDPVGIATIVIFIAAYGFVIAEEFLDLRKSKPILLAAGLMWAVIAFRYAMHDLGDSVATALRLFLVEFAELFLFLLVAMTYVNALSERNVFLALRSWLVRQGYGYRQLFWITGILTFFLSPIIDNLTAALVMGTVAIAVGQGNPRFIAVSCINIVVASNAGGAFSPFGDITTLMVWQHGTLEFQDFFALFLPSVANYVVPAGFMYMAIPAGSANVSSEVAPLKRGGRVIMLLFGCTILTTVAAHNFLHIPPFMGMMTGMAYLKIYAYYLHKTHAPGSADDTDEADVGDVGAFDSFRQMARIEWDTLLFFFGVIMCVGGLGFVGYLEIMSQYIYVELGPTTANVLVGVLSGILDNIPIMVAVLQMDPTMDPTQWLLVTLTAGIGGSLFSIGSAAGVALMGQARGTYTFMSHLRWSPAIALGFVLSIVVHLGLSGQLV